MTISSQVRKSGPFVGNDSSTVFPFTFKVFSSSDMYVVKTDTDLGVDTTLVLNTDYTVSLNADQNTSPGGTITLPIALATGFNLTVTSSLQYLQPTDLTNQGGFYPSVITNALDRLTILCQQLFDSVGRSLKLPVSTPSGVSTTLPVPSPNELIGWNAAADGLQNVDPTTLATIVAFGTAKADVFDGDGATTQFNLSANPAALNNLDVSIGGVTQTPGVNYTWASGTVITFTSAPPLGTDNVLVRYMQALPQGTTDAGSSFWTDNGGDLRDVEGTLQRLTGEVISVKDPRFGAVGDGVTDDTAAIQAAINYCVNEALYFPSGTYKVTSQLSIASPTFAAGETIKLYGDGPYNSVIAANGNFTALFVQDSAGTKGGAYDLGIINTGNPYMGGGAVTFNHATSVGIKLRDVFQFELDNVIVEQFGAGLLINNYNYWSEGTFTKNFWARNNKIGVHFLRENAGTDSFSHTQMIGLKIQVPKDNATGKWQTAFKVEGLPAGAGAVQIYNGYIQGNFWTGDGTGSAPNLGEYIYLTNKGRITESFVAISFERFGKILIDDTSYFANCHTFFSSLDASQVSLVDNNTSKSSKFRSQYRGNINLNAVNMSVVNWQGTGVTASMRQGMQDASSTGFHFGTGAGLSFPFTTSLNGAGNGFFYGTSPDYEDNVTWRFKVDTSGKVYACLTTAYIQAATGSGPGMSAGSIHQRTDTDRAVDLSPVWVGIGGGIDAPLQVARIVTTAGRPSAPTGGQMFFDSTLGKPVWWNGSNWKDATGATV